MSVRDFLQALVGFLIVLLLLAGWPLLTSPLPALGAIPLWVRWVGAAGCLYVVIRVSHKIGSELFTALKLALVLALVVPVLACSSSRSGTAGHPPAPPASPSPIATPTPEPSATPRPPRPEEQPAKPTPEPPPLVTICCCHPNGESDPTRPCKTRKDISRALARLHLVQHQRDHIGACAPGEARG